MPVSHAHTAEDSGRPNERFAVPPILRRQVAVIAFAGILLVIVPAMVVAGETAPGGLDRRIESILSDQLPTSTTAALAVDWLGEPVGLALSIAAVATLCVISGRYRLALLAVAGTVLAGVSTAALKPIVDRRIYGEFLSYPSGHTAVLVALGFVLALLLIGRLGKGRFAALLIVIVGVVTAGTAMAWAQVVLGAHYPTDTLGGFGVALAVVPAVACLIDWAAETRQAIRLHG